MRSPWSLALLVITPASLAAEPAPSSPIAVSVPQRREPISYAKEVADVLDAKCVGCHNGALAESKLNLEDVAAMLKGGKRGPAVVAGRAEESLLFKLAAHRAEPAMPPKNKKDQTPLTPEELGLIKLWIDAGAKDDSDANPEGPKPIELGALPPGVRPIVALDMTADGARVAAGRANVVQVYDVDSGLEIVTLGGHKDIIQSLRYSPDGKKLAAGSYQIVTVWDVPVGGLKATAAGHNDQVKAVAPLLDESGFVSGGLDRTVRFWDASGKSSRQFSTPAPVLALAVEPDGRTLAVGGADGVIRILDAADGKERLALKGHIGPVTGVVALGAGDRVASVSADGTAQVWSIPPTDEFQQLTPIVLGRDLGPLRAVAAVADGSKVAAAGDRGEIRLWDAAGGEDLGTIAGPGGAILSLAFSPKGDRILAGLADRTARLYDAENKTPIRTLTGHAGPVNGVAFSPDGGRLATAGGEGGVKIWDSATGNGVIAFGHAAPNNATIQPIQAVAFDGDGAIITASADKTLKCWAFEGSWSERTTLGPHVFRVLALDFSPDGTLLAAGGGEPSRSGEVKFWEVGSGKLVRSLDSLHSDTVFGLRFSPDGAALATAAADKLLKVTRVADGKELKTFEGHTHHVLAVDWKSDGKQLASCGGDNVIKTWDFATGEQLKTLSPAGKQLTALRWLPGKPALAGASGDKSVRLWNPDSGEKGQVTRTFGGPNDFVYALAVSADGGRVAAGCADGVLLVWNGQNAQILRKIDPPTSGATASRGRARASTP